MSSDELSQRLTSSEIPQADDPTRVQEFALALREPATLGLEPRDISYYRQAARILGFLDQDNKPTRACLVLRELSEPERMQRLALAFESSTVGRRWVAWSNKEQLEDINPRSAEAFLVQCSQLEHAMRRRRARTLRRWAIAFQTVRMSERRGLNTRPVAPIDSGHPAVFEPERSLAIIRTHAEASSFIRIASAYLHVSGIELIAGALDQSIVQLLVGDDQEWVLKQAYDVVTAFEMGLLGGPQSGQRSRAIRRLHRALISGRARVRDISTRVQHGLHGKLYVFDHVAAYVTSANLTRPGLLEHIESGYVVTEPDHVDRYARRFDEYFAEATRIESDVVEKIEGSWVFAEPAQPFLFYLKMVQRLLGTLPIRSKESGIQLAEFQQLIARSVLFQLRHYRGSLLISPTGTGKTFIGIYLASCLFPTHVERIVVICPNKNLGRIWERRLAGAGLPVRIVTHGILQEKGRHSDQRTRALENLILQVRTKDLIIVDECHHFRNPESNGYKNLARFVRSRATDRPLCLMLTATPVSTGPENLNSLLSLVSPERLERVEQIDSIRCTTNVTLPFILREFGRQSPRKSGRALRFGEKYLHYPTIRFVTVKYQCSISCIFSKIGSMDLRFVGSESDELSPLFPEIEEVREGKGNGLLRTILLKRAESSLFALRETIGRLIEGVHTGRIRPLNPKQFEAELLEIQKSSKSLEDEKFARLIEVIRSIRADRKILIFSESSDTVDFLTRRIARHFRRNVESITGQCSTREKADKMDRFAPQARGARPQGKEIHILVATDSISEGQDLQDAQHLINYDLTWTPLKLIQRVGRVDRPGERSRVVKLFNFYPGADIYEQLTGQWSRLELRAEEYDTLSRMSVLGDHERDPETVTQREVGLVKQLFESQNFEELLDAYLPTSSILRSYRSATEDERQRARLLPDGVISGMAGAEKAAFCLVSLDDNYYCLYFTSADRVLKCSPANTSHEWVLSRILATRETALQLRSSSDRVYDISSRIIRHWANETRVDVEKIQTLGTMLVNDAQTSPAEEGELEPYQHEQNSSQSSAEPTTER